MFLATAAFDQRKCLFVVKQENTLEFRSAMTALISKLHVNLCQKRNIIVTLQQNFKKKCKIKEFFKQKFSQKLKVV